MRILLTALAACAVVFAGGAAGATASYSDPLGDASCCNDLGAVTVTNDAAGAITFRIEMPHDPSPEAGRPVMIWLNTDLDRSTGGVPGLPNGQAFRRFGADYRIVLDTAGDPKAFLQFLSYGREVFVGTLDASYDHGWTVAVDRRLIGGGSAFEFFVLGFQIDAGASWLVTDDAPDAAQGAWGWKYDTGLPPLVTRPTLTAGQAQLGPNPPRAGRRLVARVPFELTSTESVPLSARCSASVGGRALRTSSVGDFNRNLDNGTAVCAWIVPRTARGKLVRGSVTVVAGGATVRRSFVARAR